MTYLIRDKKTKSIIYDTPTPISPDLKGIDIYPEFNGKTMELLKFDGPNPPEHFKVNKKGFMVAKTLKELAKEGLIKFGAHLSKYIDYQAAMDHSGQNRTHFHVVQLGLKLKLIKTLYDCQQAFSMLDDEFESRVGEKYRPGLEAKIMKDYIAWMDEGKPEGDKRETKYKTMKADIESIKEEYKEVRAKLKKIILPLKEQESE
jgi:hypothetical protein